LLILYRQQFKQSWFICYRLWR